MKIKESKHATTENYHITKGPKEFLKDKNKPTLIVTLNVNR